MLRKANRAPMFINTSSIRRMSLKDLLDSLQKKEAQQSATKAPISAQTKPASMQPPAQKFANSYQPRQDSRVGYNIAKPMPSSQNAAAVTGAQPSSSKFSVNLDHTPYQRKGPSLYGSYGNSAKQFDAAAGTASNPAARSPNYRHSDSEPRRNSGMFNSSRWNQVLSHVSKPAEDNVASKKPQGTDILKPVGGTAAGNDDNASFSDMLASDPRKLSGEERYVRHMQNLKFKRDQYFGANNGVVVQYKTEASKHGVRTHNRFNNNNNNQFNNGNYSNSSNSNDRASGDKRSERKAKAGPIIRTIQLPSHGYVTVKSIGEILHLKKEVLEGVLTKLGELPENYTSDDSLFIDVNAYVSEAKANASATTEAAAESHLHLVKIPSISKPALTNGLTNVIDADVAELLILELNRSDVVVTREKSAKRDIINASRFYSQQQSNATTAANGQLPAATEMKMSLRSPIVTIMGHVDHGKTTLLDFLRSSDVAAKESGGITQRLSAFAVPVVGKGDNKDENLLEHQKQVVFLDTPGHAAFQSMRSCGVSATDLVVLVVAIDDGIRPQTIEAAKTAMESKCNIIVAINKIDKIADEGERAKLRQNILNKLLEYEIVAEEMGGTTPVVEISGKTGIGVNNLIDMIMLQAEVMELRTCAEGYAETTVLDARMEKGKGIIADVLVRWGNLKVGDNFVAGESMGRVKVMEDSSGRRIQSAGPATPVRLMGFRTIPAAGVELLSVESDEKARQITDRRVRMNELRSVHEAALRHKSQLAAAETAEKLKEQQDKETKKLAEIGIVDKSAPPAVPTLPVIELILKADGKGTLQALEFLTQNIAQKVADIVEIKVIRASVGDVSPSDVQVAEKAPDTPQAHTNKDKSQQTVNVPATILGFNVKVVDSSIRSQMKHSDVDFVNDTVIYRLEDHIIAMVEQFLPKEKIETIDGTAKVLQVFNYKDKAKTVVAGSSVETGMMHTSGQERGVVYFRVKRLVEGEWNVIVDNHNGGRLKRFKDSVHEVKSGFECGFSLDKFVDFQVDDVIECVKVDYKTKKLTIDTLGSQMRANQDR